MFHEETVPLAHPRFRKASVRIFTRRLVDDCMTHRCAMADTHAEKLDACCQHGCDVDLAEQAAIVEREPAIRALLRSEVQARPWFDPELEHDPDFASGAAVRTTTVGGGCIFLAHDRRGCAIHGAALAHGWELGGLKPAVCRLFPLSYDRDAIVVSEDYPDYSCAHGDGPTLYRITRATLGELFGDDLVTAMDAAEARVLTTVPRKLRVV
jgi:hypothetical protein